MVLVLFRHITLPPDSAPGFSRFLANLLYEAGWAGVDLFFVLSGFLISGLLFREFQTHNRIDFKRFFIRRGLKIYPPFFVLIGATVGWALMNRWNLPLKRIFAELFFVQNYFEGLWSQTWSLAVEEHFYLMLPLLLILLARLNPRAKDPFRSLVWIYPLLALLVLALRLCTVWRAGVAPSDVGPFCFKYVFPTHLRIDSLFLGVLIGYAFHYRYQFLSNLVARFKIGLVLFAVAALLPLCVWPMMTTPYHYTFGFTVTALGFAAVLLLGVTGQNDSNNTLVRLWAYVGAHSYSIYLWHMAVAMVLHMVFKRWHGAWWIEAGSYLAFSVIAGIVLAKLVDIPVLHIRDRWFPSRSQPLRP